jgi:hypothetical protein
MERLTTDGIVRNFRDELRCERVECLRIFPVCEAIAFEGTGGAGRRWQGWRQVCAVDPPTASSSSLTSSPDTTSASKPPPTSPPGSPGPPASPPTSSSASPIPTPSLSNTASTAPFNPLLDRNRPPENSWARIYSLPVAVQVVRELGWNRAGRKDLTKMRFLAGHSLVCGGSHPCVIDKRLCRR